MQTEKKCPKCKQSKPADDFDIYFSKSRQKFRLQSYCKGCSPAEKRKRSSDYYQKHRKERIAYAKEYSNRTENIEKDRRQKLESKRKRRDRLADSYVRDLMVQKYKFSNQELIEDPELVELYRKTIMIKRLLKQKK